MLLHFGCCWRTLLLLTLTLPIATSTQRQLRRGVSSTSAILPAHIVLRSDPVNNLDIGRSEKRWRGRSGSGAGGSRRKWSKWRLRPTPDDDGDGLPVLPLDVANGGDRLLQGPTSRDLEPRTLTALLGEEFDVEYMAITRPSDSVAHPNGTYLYDASSLSRGFAVRLPRLRGFRIPGSPDSAGRIAIKGRAARRRAQRYLAAYSYCPVFARWRDLGRRFWPRWIREGSCRGDQRARSCSMPPGMTCRPHRSATKTVLWWHCRTTSRGRPPPSSSSSLTSATACGWIPVKYPVITACRCSC